MHAFVAIPCGDLLCSNAYSEWINLLLGQSSSQYNFFEAQGFLRFFNSLVGEFGKYVWLATIVVFLAGGLVLHRVKAAAQVVAAYWIAGNYLLSPLPWWYQILFMYPAAFLLLNQRDVGVSQKRAVAAALGVYALLTFNLVGRAAIITVKEWQVFFLCSSIILGIFLTYIVRPNRSSKIQSV